MSKCKKCGLQKETYYREYCPKCDIQDIIKDDHGWCLIPILNYGEQYLEDFSKDKIWDMFCDNDTFRNDVYVKHTFRNSEADKMLKEVLDTLKVDYDKSILFWVSW